MNLSDQLDETKPPVLHHVTPLTNQNPIIIQACNLKNHEALSDIFPFTSQSPRDYTISSTTSVIQIFYYPNGNILFGLFAFPYIIHRIHKYRHPWSLFFESWYLHFPSAIHLIQVEFEGQCS